MTTESDESDESEFVETDEYDTLQEPSEQG